jgi:hypothetical protein
MNSTEREILRLSLLRHLDARTGYYGLQAPLLRALLRNEGLTRITLEDIHKECQYLADKHLIEATLKKVSPENTAWRITAAGRDFFAENDPD